MCSGALRNHATKDPPYGNGADLTAGGIARDITRLAKSNETTPQKPGTDRGGVRPSASLWQRAVRASAPLPGMKSSIISPVAPGP